MQQRSNNQVQGFFVGVIVGVLVTLLFTTKKGRQILRTLTEEGLHKFSEVEDIIQAMEEEAGYDDIGEVVSDDLVEEEPEVRSKTVESVEEEKPEKKSEHPIVRVATHGRKFFRKPTRK